MNGHNDERRPRARSGAQDVGEIVPAIIPSRAGAPRALRIRVRVGENGHTRTWVYVNADAADRAVQRAEARGQTAVVDLVEIVPVGSTVHAPQPGAGLALLDAWRAGAVTAADIAADPDSDDALLRDAGDLLTCSELQAMACAHASLAGDAFAEATAYRSHAALFDAADGAR